ncbi:MAG TPA: 5-deoxy-glucuronate isomerase [Hyphomicrobiaceae bacterium]|jgi:5-deoxy-glucuronate isomerase|nr:5-deoxy-glucuronate isomerase [Hyphomicrobiaceae bacterium]
MNRESRVIRAGCSASPLVQPGNGGGLELIYFDVLRLARGEERVVDLPGFEVHLVPFTGTMDVEIDGTSFPGVGHRASIWDGHADSLYAGAGHPITLRAATDNLEVAVAGGVTDQRFEPFRVRPDQVRCVEVGSTETKSRRRICHLLGQNGAGRAGNLLVSELYAEEGCWSGYPPHKHDTDRVEPDKAMAQVVETDHEELYHFRYRPETGFGAQFKYRDGEEPRVEMVRHGDSFAIPNGYHPTVTSPGHDGYIFTVLVGRNRRGLVQYFEPAHAHLIPHIPGIASMRKAFE